MLFNFSMVVYFIALFLLVDGFGRQFIRINYQGEISPTKSYFVHLLIVIVGFICLSGLIRISNEFPPTEFNAMRLVTWVTIITIIAGLIEGIGINTILIKSGLVKRK